MSDNGNAIPKFVADMIGYVQYTLDQDDTTACVYIVDALNHDITGMIKTELRIEGYEPGVFVPRCNGYAKYVPKHVKDAMSTVNNNKEV